MTFELQYVPHARVSEFEANGWRVVSKLQDAVRAKGVFVDVFEVAR